MKRSKTTREFRKLFRKKIGGISREETEGIEYRPMNLKDMLIEMRDKAERIVDLAYSSVVLNSRDMAEEVRKIEVEMDELLYHIRMAAILAVRNPEDAAQMSGILQFAEAIENVSDAALDIIEISFEGRGEMGPIFSFILKEADEKIGTVIVDENSSMVRKKIRELMIESELGVRIIAIKRKKGWVYDINGDTRIRENDVLVLTGVEEGIRELDAYASGKVRWGEYKAQRSHDSPGEKRKTSKGIEMFLHFKNRTELMIDVAISSLLYANRELAEEVYVMEGELSELYTKVLRCVLTDVSRDNVDFAISFIKMLNGMEAIGDAATEIANIVLRDIEPHAVLKRSIIESDVAIVTVPVSKKSKLANKKLGEVMLASETGMWVFAIKRKDGWIFGPTEDSVILPGDTLFARGPYEGKKILMKWAGKKKK